eukprot:gene5743-7132_t
MTTATLPLDIGESLAHGIFPERRDIDEPLHDRFARGVLWRLKRRLIPAVPTLRAMAKAAGDLEAEIQQQTDAELRRRLFKSAPAAVQAGRASGLAEAMALVREGARRSLDKRPFDTQLMGAAVLLEGRLAEMQTGE